MIRIYNLFLYVLKQRKKSCNCTRIQSLIITNTGELFCHMEETSSPVIFTCKTNLELISQSSHIFADGTFSYAPKYFEQLYSIHILQNGFYVPVIYFLIS